MTRTVSGRTLSLDTRLRQGRWDSQWAIGAAPPPLWPELAGKTLGILGLGHIGQALARRALAFDMQGLRGAVRRRIVATTGKRDGGRSATTR